MLVSNNLRRIMFLILLLHEVVPLHGALIGGCVDSPENPTALLGLVGLAGIVAISSRRKLLSRWRDRKNRKS
jgi:XrtJ-associated TM-motif-TM protein